MEISSLKLSMAWKGCEGSEIWSCLQARKLVCDSFMDSETRRDTWVRDKGLYYYSNSSGQNICICTSSLSLNFWRQLVGLHYTKETLSLGTKISYNGWLACLTFTKEGNMFFIILCNNKNFSLFWTETIYFFQGCLLWNLFKKEKSPEQAQLVPLLAGHAEIGILFLNKAIICENIFDYWINI